MFNMMSVAEAQAKQNKSLDVALLCKKLEAHKKEQDIMRLRQERKSETKNGKFVLKNAAKQFVATATPARDDTARRRYHSATLALIAEPYDDRRTILGKSQVYATTMRVGVKGHDGVATLVAKRQTSGSRVVSSGKRDSTSPRFPAPAAEEGEESPRDHITTTTTVPGWKAPTITTTHFSASGRPKPRIHRRSSSQKEVEQVDRKTTTRDFKQTKQLQPQSQQQPDNDTGILYRPGDAAKRRSMFENTSSPFITAAADFSNSDSNSKRRTSIHNLPLGQQQSARQTSLPILEDAQRPKLLPHDRPDWCQRSENGDSSSSSSHGGFSLFAAMVKGGKGDEEKERVGSQQQQDGHLIADAVKLIRQQEKLQRRRGGGGGVMGFFKKL